jgi:two-component system, NarL family, captular synthesis response regulator RcsB
MIRKVLIAEDHESMNISLQKTLEDLGIDQTDHVYYCDDALAKIQLGVKTDQPYDLLVTDLYFEEDDTVQQISDGRALIPAVRKIQPEIKILVFSAESKAAVIEMLYKKLEIDGYVRKARHDAKELKSALECISGNQRYFPRHLMQMIRQKNTYEFTDYDITIISLLAEGMRQNQIPAYLKEKQFSKSSLSSIEKQLNYIKDVLGFSKNEQLVAFCKDMGII